MSSLYETCEHNVNYIVNAFCHGEGNVEDCMFDKINDPLIQNTIFHNILDISSKRNGWIM